MAKNDKKATEVTVEEVEEVEKATEKVKFTSDYKSLMIAGTNIVFRNGEYETEDELEIALLRNNSAVVEVEAGE